jgi:hypothetical protein
MKAVETISAIVSPLDSESLAQLDLPQRPKYQTARSKRSRADERKKRQSLRHAATRETLMPAPWQAQQNQTCAEQNEAEDMKCA